MEWFLLPWQRYAEFDGRSRRKEYWLFTLGNTVAMLLLGMLSGMMGNRSIGIVGIMFFIYCIASIIPSLAVSIRRLHDTGRSGWWFLISLVPLVGGIILLVFSIQDSDAGTNAYGQNPKAFG